MATKKKLSMAEFKALRQSRAFLDQGRSLQELREMDASRQEFEKAVEASEFAVEARIALAQSIWDSARSQTDLDRVEKLLKEAVVAADSSGSAQESVHKGKAAQKLGLLLCQAGKEHESRELLLSGGFVVRLSSAVLQDRGVPLSTSEKDEERDSILAVVNNALSDEMLQHLQQTFDPDAAFWREHEYYTGRTGYFSYLHPLGAAPENNLEQVIHHLWRISQRSFPAAAEATHAEWWAHTRPHPSGHQLHFDSDDEGIGGVRNPIVTSVTYLSDGAVGGPTLVTNQRLEDSGLACRGWLVRPKLNRFVVFDGKVLHGVIPGASYRCASHFQRPLSDSTLPAHPKRAPPNLAAMLHHADREKFREQGGRRTTLMVAFWREIKGRGSAEDGPGASKAFPVKGATRFTWAEPLRSVRSQWDSLDLPPIGEGDFLEGVAAVDKVWERVDGSKGSEGTEGPMPGYEECFQGF